jgi:ABC-type nitrate/sulfonate/bicarbonate transport system ATPase subunit
MIATATRTDTLLSIENVSLSYGQNVVLRDVNASIKDLVRPGCVTGQVVSILGRSGCGKTSLLRIIAGLQKATSGSVTLGKDRAPAKAGDVGLVSQNYLLYRNRDVLSNLVIAARQSRDNPNARIATQRAIDLLDDFGLLDKKHLYPSQLSGGQKQRVSIAQQILACGEMLLWDEPTAGLDPIAKKKVCELVGKVANRDELSSCLIVTHDIPSAVTVSDTLWLIGTPHGETGSRIVQEYDLISMGLAFQPDIQRLPEFTATVRELQDRFATL